MTSIEYVSKADLEARRKGVELFKKSFGLLVKRLLDGRTPVLVLPKRTLSNTIYDERRKLLLLGPEMLRRSFLDVNEARKFMQTTLMASIIYDALVNNEYPTIRDLYYRGKHTITYRDEKGRRRYEPTWSEQRESDSVIRDLEVYLGILREELLILSKEKGKVVGNMKIRSGDDVIDLSKMGHGAYAIEPTPDLIEFLDVDAEYVLVVEKDAVFQQLHRYKFWKKHKAILITSAGQPDRATRRFVRRLNEELKLPVYIMTDSIPGDEVVIVRDSVSKRVYVKPIEELLGRYFSSKDKERVSIPLEVPSWDPVSGSIKWMRVGYVYRHRIRDRILKIKTKGRGVVRVTKAHSLFIFRNGRILVVPAHEIRPGDYIVVADKLPLVSEHSSLPVIDVVELLKRSLKNSKCSSRFSIEKTVKVGVGGEVIELDSVSSKLVGNTSLVLLSRLRHDVPARIVVDSDLAWLLGLYTARGVSYKGRYLVFNLSIHELSKVDRIVEIVKSRFNIEPVITSNGEDNQLCVIICSRTLYMVFKELGLIGRVHTKRVPDVIVNAPPQIVLSYIKGLIDGDGHIDVYGGVVYSTRSKILSKQLFNLLLSLGVLPTLTVNGDDNIIRISKSPARTPIEIYAYLTSSSLNNEYKVASKPTYGIPIDNRLKKILVKLMNNSVINCSPRSKTISKTKLARVTNIVEKLPRDYNVIVYGDVVLVRVDSVEEEDYEGYVYDFAVPETNSFIGGYGVVYHNSDPYGWYIYSVFKIGSITLSYESERLATSDAKFIGVSMTDVFGDDILRKNLSSFRKKIRSRINRVKSIEDERERAREEWRIPLLEELDDMLVKSAKSMPRKKPYLSKSERSNFIIKAKKEDVARAIELVGYDVADVCLKEKSGLDIDKKKELVGYPWFRTPAWIRELCIFFQTLAKLEIEAMASKGLKFLADTYIPQKIETQDWID